MGRVAYGEAVPVEEQRSDSLRSRRDEKGDPMHWTRIWTLVGVVLGVAALFTKGATTDGEELLPALNESGAAFPDGISTIWGGLDTWVQVLVGIAIVVVVVFAFMPPLNLVEKVPYALTTTLIGVALLIYAIIKYLEASDDASALQDGFAEAAAGGAIPAAFEVSVGWGFYVLMAGTAMVAIGGLVMLINRDSGTGAAAR
jgi:hypothetical protein